MKKKFKSLFIITFALAMGLFSADVCFAKSYDYRHPIPEEKGFKSPVHKNEKGLKQRPPSREEFEKRLNLTQEQKDIAKAQREKSIEKIKPLIEQIDFKKTQMSNLSSEQDPELYNKLESEVRALRRQCHEIRKENMKAFEASLTEEQKREMHKMKEEGRKRFEQHNKMERK